jgi:hypothetical protein
LMRTHAPRCSMARIHSWTNRGTVTPSRRHCSSSGGGAATAGAAAVPPASPRSFTRAAGMLHVGGSAIAHAAWTTTAQSVCQARARSTNQPCTTMIARTHRGSERGRGAGRGGTQCRCAASRQTCTSRLRAPGGQPPGVGYTRCGAGPAGHRRTPTLFPTPLSVPPPRPSSGHPSGRRPHRVRARRRPPGCGARAAFQPHAR